MSSIWNSDCLRWSRCYIGDNPKFPLLVRSEYDFAPIEEEGKELPFSATALPAT
jgi:hypothetical protein